MNIVTAAAAAAAGDAYRECVFYANVFVVQMSAIISPCPTMHVWYVM